VTPFDHPANKQSAIKNQQDKIKGEPEEAERQSILTTTTMGVRSPREFETHETRRWEKSALEDLDNYETIEKQRSQVIEKKDEK